MSNTTTYTSLRHQHDVSVGDASATTLLSYFLLRIIQWILASGINELFNTIFLIFTLAGIAVSLLTPTTSKKDFNNQNDTIRKKYV
jgi:hypothetical protein